MYCVSPALYHEAAARLVEAIGGENYFSGTVAFRYGSVDCRLTVSVIVYRIRVVLPEGVRYPVTDLMPVWWEFHTSDERGERLNDFSFSEMLRYLAPA